MNKFCMNGDSIAVQKFCNITNDSLELYPFWTEIAIPETLIIPEQKPDIEQLNSVKVEVKILRKKIIQTPQSDSSTPPIVPPDNWEGKILTNRKLIVEGELLQTIVYTADVPEQSLHTAHFVVPFSAFIVLEADTDLDDNFVVNACVEDVFIKNICPRQIFKNITLLLHAVPTPFEECPEDC